MPPARMYTFKIQDEENHDKCVCNLTNSTEKDETGLSNSHTRVIQAVKSYARS